MTLEQLEEKFTRYEIARILGARSLQLAMDAPVLLKMSKDEEEELNFDTLRIAEKEFESDVLPITVKRPLPKKSEKQIKKLTEEEVKEKLEKKAEKEKKEIEKLEEKKEEIEEREEKEIQQQGEIMEMANPGDEDNLQEEKVSEEA
jgi:DNA-directed RNA polymerase subunit K